MYHTKQKMRVLILNLTYMDMSMYPSMTSMVIMINIKKAATKSFSSQNVTVQLTHTIMKIQYPRRASNASHICFLHSLSWTVSPVIHTHTHTHTHTQIRYNTYAVYEHTVIIEYTRILYYIYDIDHFYFHTHVPVEPQPRGLRAACSSRDSTSW